MCEIGLNHLGDVDKAELMLDTILDNDFTGLTFQIIEKSFYMGKWSTYQLPEYYYQRAIKKANLKKKKFGIALGNYNKVADYIEMGVDFFKILSWGLTNYDFIDSLLSSKCNFYLSTGIADEEDLIKFKQRFKGMNNLNSYLLN